MIVYRAIGTRSEKLCYRNGTRNGMRNGMRNLFLIFEDQLKLCWFIVNYLSLLICASLMHTFLILFMILLLKIFYLYKLLPLSYLIDVVLQNDPKFEMVSLNLFFVYSSGAKKSWPGWCLEKKEPRISSKKTNTMIIRMWYGFLRGALFRERELTKETGGWKK